MSNDILFIPSRVKYVAPMTLVYFSWSDLYSANTLVTIIPIKRR